MLCQGCSIAKCIDCPSVDDPISIACPQCEETGCDDCEQKGFFNVDHCPQTLLDDGLSQFIQLADLFDEGIAPVAGGSLDQAQWFLTASRYFKRQENRVERERLK